MSPKIQKLLEKLNEVYDPENQFPDMPNKVKALFIIYHSLTSHYKCFTDC